jgi:hypothetical protein
MPRNAELVTEEHIELSIISYKDLLASIGAPETLAHSIGKYLYEVASWCADGGHPPVNALAVNGKLSQPGVGYFFAPGGGNWEAEVRECIAHSKYPTRITELK